MARVVLLLTNTFPFGTGEPFVGTELPYLAAGSDAVIVVATQAGEGTPRPTPPGVELWTLRTPASRPQRAASFAEGAVRAVAAGSLGRMWISGESWRANRVGMAFEARAQWSWARLRPMVDAAGLAPTDEVCIYSYWFHHTARLGELLAGHLRRTCPRLSVRLVSRAHGYDLYEDRHRGFLPQRRDLLRAFDAVYPVSSQGEAHLRSRVPEFADRVAVRHLGTGEPGAQNTPSRERLRVMSCAYVTPVKRLERIPAIVEKLADDGADVVWTHLGAGPGFNELAEIAERTCHRAEVQLLGSIAPERIFDAYAEHAPTVFLSVSASEGVPVSMMEASSCGVPIVSTDVGGVRDIVVPGVSGDLIPAEFTDDDAILAIRRIWELPQSEYDSLQASTRQLWRDRFRAGLVYPAFAEDLWATR